MATRSVRAGVAVLLMVLLVGVGSADASSRTDATAGGSSNAASGTGAYPRRDVTPKELAADIETATRATDGFWRRHWSDFFTGSYTAPRVVGLYDGTKPGTAPTCRGKPLPINNALYCSSGDFVAWDASLMLRGAQIGDAWVYLVISHEWGHAIQERLDTTLRAQRHELQADCLAGATLYGSKADGVIVFEKGDENEIVSALNLFADKTPWTDVTDHGDAFERIGAFGLGRRGGVRACLPSTS